MDANNSEIRLTPTDGPPVVFSGIPIGAWSTRYEDGCIRSGFQEEMGTDERRYKSFVTAKLYRTAAGKWVVHVMQEDPHRKRRGEPMLAAVVVAKDVAELQAELAALDVWAWWPSPWPDPKDHQAKRWLTKQTGIRQRFSVVIGHICKATGEEVRIA